MLLAGVATPACAQLGGSISFQTDDYFRGYSLSEGRPVATLNLSYDAPSGLYGTGTVTAVATRQSGIKLLGFQENVGFARRIAAGPIIDVGFTNASYSEYYSGGRDADYREVYAGLITDHIATHLHYAPHYFRGGISTLYVEADGVLHPLRLWRLTGHIGVLKQLDGPHMRYDRHPHYDWRLGLGRRVGPFDLQLAWADGAPGPDYYAGERHRRGAITFAISYAF